MTRHSAVPRDYAVASQRLALYRKLLAPPEAQPERDLFPGGMPLTLAVVGAAPPVSMATVALLAATAVSFDGSLGTNGLIYHPLYGHLLPFRGLRVPARFAALVGTGLILLSAFGARRVLKLAGTRRNRILLCMVLASGALIDGRSRIASVRFSPNVHRFIRVSIPVWCWRNYRWGWFRTSPICTSRPFTGRD